MCEFVTVRFVERDLWLKVPAATDKKKPVKFYIAQVADRILSQFADESLHMRLMDLKFYGLYSVTHKYWLENDRTFDDYNISMSASADPQILNDSADVIELQNRQNFINTSSAPFHHYSEGFLFKKGERSFAWRKRFFILRNSILSFYKERGDKLPTGHVDLTLQFQIKVETNNSTTENPNNTELHLITNSKVYRLKSDNLPEITNWIRIIKCIRSENHDPFSAKSPLPPPPQPDPNYSSADNSFLDSSSDEIEPFIPFPIERKYRSESTGVGTPNGRSFLRTTFGHLRLSDAMSRAASRRPDTPPPLSQDDPLQQITPGTPVIHADIQGDKIGYLYKKGNLNGILRYRLFVLRDKILYYYKLVDGTPDGSLSLNNNTLYKYTGLINLEGVRIFSDHKEGKKAYIFRIVAPSRAYLLCTSVREEFEDWKDAFEFVSGLVVEDMSSSDLKQSLIDEGADLSDTEKPHKVKLKLNYEKYGNPDYEGYLMKQGNDRLGKWRMRWFILLGRTLFYCKEKGLEPLGSIPLSISSVESSEQDLSIDVSVRNSDISLPSLRVFHLKALEIVSFKQWKDLLTLFCTTSTSSTPSSTLT